MTQKKTDLYRPPQVLSHEKPEEEVAFYLIARILRILDKLKLQTPKTISQQAAMRCAVNITARLR